MVVQAPSTLKLTMMMPNKKVGNRASNSVSRKTLAEDVFSVAGDTTLPSCQVEEDETDSFASSVCSVAKDDDMDTDGSGKRPAEVQTLRRANATFIDVSETKKATQDAGFSIGGEDMSLGLEEEKAAHQQQWNRV